MTKEYPWGKGTPTWVRDATANDSDKSFTVPAGKVREYLSIGFELVATATVGSRTMKVLFTDGTSNLHYGQNLAGVAASQIATYNINQNTSVPGSTVGIYPMLSNGGAGNISGYGYLPTMRFAAGSVLRIYDSAAIDAAADDLTVVLHYVEYDA